jgi:hypothetical protein
MIGNDWEVSCYVYKNLLQEKTATTPTVDMEMRKVNYWISMKNLYGLESIKKEIEEYDVSAMEGQFKVAKACLLNEFKEINSLLEQYINTQIQPQSIEDWPLFIQYRKSSEYRNFKKTHSVDFEKQVYDPEEIQREDMCDSILEKSEKI